MDTTDAIKNIAEANGIAFFGTSYVAENLPEKLAHLPYAVTIGMRYPKTIIAEIEKAPTSIYFHHYRTMNANLDRTAIQIESKLLDMGHEAIYIPASQSLPGHPFSALFSHKIAAVKAGLGFIGKNNLFIHKSFGPGVRLCTVFTSMKMPVLPEEALVANACGECTQCFDACPAAALYNRIPKSPYNSCDIVDVEKCSYTMKKKYQHIGRGSVCGICIAACPFSK